MRLVIAMSAGEKLQNFSNNNNVAESFKNNDSAVVDKRLCLVAEKCEEKCDSDKSETINDEVVRSSFKVDEGKKSKSSQYNCCTDLRQTAALWWTERVILTVVCIVIAAGFTIPIIIYAIDTDRGENSALSIDIDVDSCQTSTFMAQDDDVQVLMHAWVLHNNNIFT